MALGTAGFTAALAVHRLEVNGQRPENWVPSVVTGASGGVGCIALDMLSTLGYETVALSERQTGTGRVSAAPWRQSHPGPG